MTSIFSDLQARLSGSRGALIDSNILLDVATRDPAGSEWSSRALAEIADHTVLIVNPIVYAEVSIGFTTIEALDAAMPLALYRREPLPWEAAFLAGKCFLKYRRLGGARGDRPCRTSISEPTPQSSVWGARARSGKVSNLFSGTHAFCTRLGTGGHRCFSASPVDFCNPF